PEPLDALVQPGPVESLARLESPGGWQRAGLAACALAAAALALALASAYGGPRRSWALPMALGALALSLAVGAASFVGYRSYGIMADTRAVVVWRSGSLRSIPTEADVSQKTTTLAAGSVAVADRAFLEWVRLSFPNGETGWVPGSEVVYLWRAPPK
ncbi:MAG TPA: protein BatD, partial [Opitutaceae bacterium]|nr:protein BatD [Opitutaceae bacterium]